MVVSPAILSKGKKAQKTAGKVSFSAAASTSSPIASTSKVPIAGAGTEDDADMDDDGVEGDGEWQSRQSASSAAASTSEAGEDHGNAAGTEGHDDDDAVMIDSNTLLPPVGSSHGEGDTTGADQGLLKFPALSAKQLQGKVESQTRKVSVRAMLPPGFSYA